MLGTKYLGEIIKEEKIELGIKKKDTIMLLEEFHGYISELIDDIKNYQEAIECLK